MHAHICTVVHYVCQKSLRRILYDNACLSYMHLPESKGSKPNSDPKGPFPSADAWNGTRSLEFADS